MRAAVSLAALAFVAACATPQQQCILSQTRELRVLDRLIAETDANLTRGYAIEERVGYETGWVPCGPVRRTKDGRVVRPAGLCLDDRPVTVRSPVAIDPAAEARKLEALQARRAALAARVEPAVAACRAQYPG